MSSPSSADAPGLPPPASLAIHLDLVGGISGDMFVAAMVDALPALGAVLRADIEAVQATGEPSPAFRATTSGSLRACTFGIAPPSGQTTWRTAGNDSAIAPGRAPTHAGTSYTQLRDRLAGAPLAAGTRAHALTLLELLADAEARVHGTTIDTVHFHELADWDSLLDLVAAGSIAAQLEGAHWTASALPLGGGTVHTAHGRLPVPAPATSLLLTGYPWQDDGIAGERVTPTGAAIMRHLVPPGRCAAHRESGWLLHVGCGAGTRTLPGLPNIVRALVMVRATDPDADSDVVTVLEFDVDDMTGEEIAVACDRLRAVTGVVDLSLGMRQGKKGRPVSDFRLLALPHAADAVTRACFAETSTLGLRVHEVARRVLRRAEVTAVADAATIPVKVAVRPGGERTAKAAQDAVSATQGLGERRRTQGAAVQRALGDAKK
jgi:pyridinium-3,5-bisthiocarboxylic acid mononucleotide nickel chelatase